MFNKTFKLLALLFLLPLTVITSSAIESQELAFEQNANIEINQIDTSELQPSDLEFDDYLAGCASGLIASDPLPSRLLFLAQLENYDTCSLQKIRAPPRKKPDL